jgi:TPR repeat protein
VEGRKQGSHPQRETVNLSEQADRAITLPALIAQVGRLDIDYQPVNVEVYLDGNLLGKSPDIFRNISVGSHEVELRYTGYTSKKERVTIEEGKTAKLAGSLSRIPSEDAEIEGKTAEQIRTIAYNYCEGKGGKSIDYAKAMKYSRIAAERGNTEAMNDIGLMYEKGQGVTKDDAEATRWYRKAAELGHAWGQNNLGNNYRIGRGIEKNYIEAVKWYRKAAEQGNADGQCHLGYMYEMGYGISKDYAEAIKWYKKSAEQGYEYAQKALARLFINGKCGSETFNERVRWIVMAANRGDEKAGKWLKEHKITPYQ